MICNIFWLAIKLLLSYGWSWKPIFIQAYNLFIALSCLWYTSLTTKFKIHVCNFISSLTAPPGDIFFILVTALWITYIFPHQSLSTPEAIPSTRNIIFTANIHKHLPIDCLSTCYCNDCLDIWWQLNGGLDNTYKFFTLNVLTKISLLDTLRITDYELSFVEIIAVIQVLVEEVCCF